MYALRLPGTFVPEEHGWTVRNPVVPHQQLQMAMYELHRFGFVSANYVRPEPGSEALAGLVLSGYDRETAQYLCLYNPPSECRERNFTAAVLLAEIRDGVGHSEVSA